jgi:hypothetical protein
MVMVQDFEVMLGHNAEPLCVKICNFVHCHTVLNY